MAISVLARRSLGIACGNSAVGDELADIFDSIDVLSGAEAALIDGVTAGTAAAEKAVTLDASGNVTWVDGGTINVGTTTGVQIGTAAAQKLGFFGATPVVQESHIADPSGGGTQDAEARTAINAILAALETLGFLATS